MAISGKKKTMAIQSLENFIIFPVNKYKTNSKETGKDQPIQIKHCFGNFHQEQRYN